MEETKELITKDDICSKVYIIRGQQVMLDKDLAEIYGYEVKKLNQQVKRNIERFPEDFMFRLSNSEIDSVRSQIVTSRKKDFFAGQEGGRRYLPYAFTEQGIYMLATVLRGELAEQQSIFIMRTFREMRHYIRQNQQFVTRNEMNFLTAKVGTITERQDRMENKVDSIQKDLAILADNFITDKDKKNFVIYKGQKFEADIAYIEIYQQAKKSIYVVDDYMNAKSLQHLSQKADGVEVVLFTENGKGGKGFLTKSLVTDFQNEYTSLRIKPNPDCHDRLIVLDYGEETELVYHCGASSKDAGKKLCAINQITETAIIHPVLIDYFCCQIKKYVGEIYTIVSTGDVVYIGSDLPKEYTGSKYTNSIKGTNAKAKANAATGIPELIEIAVGKHFRENNEDKHRRDGKNGWYRYDSKFALPVYDDNGKVERYNIFHASVLIRHSNDGKMYLYDIIDIKKETSNSLSD